MAATAEQLTEVLQRMEAMRMENVALKNEFTTTLNALRTEGVATTARLEESRATVIALQSRSTVGTMEPKGLQKPKDFNNSEGQWSEFSFKYENWLMGFLPGVKPYLRWAETMTGPILSYIGAPTSLSDHEIAQLSKQVYITLAQLLSDESHTILRNGHDENGLDAWRRLVKRWDPKTIGRSRNAYLKIAQPGSAKTLEQASAMLEKWETDLHRSPGAPEEEWEIN